MILPRRTGRVAALALCIFLSAVFLTVCDERPSAQENARQAQAQQQFQAQLQAEQAQRLAAENSARAAESSRDAWIIGLGAGGCLVCLVVLLVGIHIGARAIARYKKE